MDCNTCGINIPPIWKACLVSNICPSCNGKIMSDFTQELIKGLSVAITQMPNNPEGIACWLVSNYKMDKINDYEPPQFPEQKGASNINLNSSNNDKQKALEDFFTRAGVNLNDLPYQHTKVPSQVKEASDVEDVNEEPLDDVDRMMLNGSGGAGGLSEQEKEEIANSVRASKFGAEKNPAIAAMIEAQEQRKQDFADGVSAVDARGKPAGFRRA